MDDLLSDDGVLMLPTAPGPAPACGAADADPQLRFKVLSLTSIAGLAGLPQVCVVLRFIRMTCLPSPFSPLSSWQH